MVRVDGACGAAATALVFGQAEGKYFDNTTDCHLRSSLLTWAVWAGTICFASALTGT